MKTLVVSRIQTPDGTILTSKHTHDFVSHKDANGLEYFLDGGLEYQRISLHENAPAQNISLYIDSPFEEIRKYYCRGSRGKDGQKPLTYTPMCEMSNDWLENCILYNTERGFGTTCMSTYLYMKELVFRFENNIFIKD